MLSEMEEVLAYKNSYYSNCREFKTESEMLKKREERKDRLIIGMVVVGTCTNYFLYKCHTPQA